MKESDILYNSQRSSIHILDLNKVDYQEELFEEVKMDSKTGAAILDNNGKVSTINYNDLGNALFIGRNINKAIIFII